MGQNYNTKGYLYPWIHSSTIHNSQDRETSVAIASWIDNERWHIYSMEYCSAIKRNEIIPPAATWMDLVTGILREANQKNTNITWYHLYVEYKIWHKWTYLWNRNRLTDIERRLIVIKVGIERDMDWEFGISRCKLLHISRITNEVLLYSTGNHSQCPW